MVYNSFMDFYFNSKNNNMVLANNFAKIEFNPLQRSITKLNARGREEYAFKFFENSSLAEFHFNGVRAMVFNSEDCFTYKQSATLDSSKSKISRAKMKEHLRKQKLAKQNDMFSHVLKDLPKLQANIINRFVMMRAELKLAARDILEAYKICAKKEFFSGKDVGENLINQARETIDKINAKKTPRLR